ncbi:MAG: N-acetylglucosamine-6-phosphate deacetylase [Ruminococcaceae bacterium]|nr:N-acetylglucosamine-6-phosphate deacetylase [Oscillospiraceae bacterium]
MMAMERIKSNKIILPQGLFDGYVYFENGKIIDVSDKAFAADKEYDMTGLYLSAGFIDIHTHGGGGNPFEGNEEQIVNGCNFHLKHGTTSICPTVSAAEFNSMAQSVKNIKQAMLDKRVKGTIIGAHLEGPYLSVKQTGAQCADFITPPSKEDYLPLLKDYGEVIARWSYAPENDIEERFVKALSKYGVVASAGHTDAVYSDMVRAMDNGCCLVTHLFSCTSTITRDHGFRRLGVIETAFLSDEMYVEIICDGKHLPPELIKLIYKIKGADKIALVTDSLALTGTDRNHGFMQATEYIIEDGVCKLMDRSAFAGSIATADRLVRVAVKEAGISVTEAVKMITETPAKIMKLNHKGKIAQGFDADMVVFDDDIKVRKVFAKGDLIS